MMSLARRGRRDRCCLLSGLATAGAALTLATTASVSTASTQAAARTGAATAVTFAAADLTGAVNPGGQPTTYFFQYGLTTRYGSQSPATSPAVGSATVGVRSTITGLSALSTYHYRLVAINAAATAFGADATFTTLSVPLSLAISALANPVAPGAPLSLVGTLAGTGSAGSVVVLQQNPFPFTSGFQNVGSPGTTSPAGAFRFDLGPLPVTTQFRVVSVGPGQPLVSDVLTEFVHLAVTISVIRRYTRAAGSSRYFSGLITPAEVGARVSLQRQVGRHWRLITTTRSQAATASASSYAIPLVLRHSGFYRVSAASVDGGHVPHTSAPILVHVGLARK